MVDKLDQLFGFQEQALRLRSQRHQILASNIANADTPNYKARDFDFQSALQKAVGQQSGNTLPMTATASGHLTADGAPAGDVTLMRASLQSPGMQQAKSLQGEVQYRTSQQPSIDGNTVDMDGERMRFADNTVRYEADLNIVTQKIKSMLAAIQNS
ncbi:MULTISPECIES: flagellar basal body rod protein FlgB [Ralstonia]|uniref:Flagellar basal body rod protein FlgB n=1 Tax=Ralstonia flaminis TaxID=3058597 RepID=A0ABN9JEN1_9RALS|nr:MULTISPECIES: flagellar basal body rod protein FlgB [unclassified Ralstonia]CAJ0809505.1 Flagellar basal body rod protein FlgB [Ralstonia sp. LMG 18101]